MMRSSMLYVWLGVAAFAVCRPAAALGSGPLSIDGHVRYYSNQAAVDDVTIDLQGSVSQSTATDPSGTFTFDGLDTGTWMVEPHKPSPQGREVSAFDAAYALEAAARLRVLTPEQVMACDVTGDGTVGAFDAVLILEYLVGMVDRFPVATACGSDWAFIPQPSANLSTM